MTDGEALVWLLAPGLTRSHAFFDGKKTSACGRTARALDAVLDDRTHMRCMFCVVEVPGA